MKKMLLALVLALSLFGAQTVHAEETCVEVQVYGGGVGVVCGVKTHEPVPADIAGISPQAIGSGLIMGSGALVYLSRKFSRR
jgi:hypothetical protein